MNLELTPGIDVALVVVYAFFAFFLGLIFYLRREDRREGYPLEEEISGRVESPGGPLLVATTKSFKLPFGHGTVTAPTKGREPVDIAARRTDRFAGAPYQPTGNPLVDGVGPAAFADRAKRPDVDYEGHPRIVPMGSAEGFFIAKGDPDPRGYKVFGADKMLAGTVADIWVDKADRLIRYLEVAIDGGKHVLAPMTMAVIHRGLKAVEVDAITAKQFADAPAAPTNGTVTMYEEERAVAYFGGGYLYATADRAEPLL